MQSFKGEVTPHYLKESAKLFSSIKEASYEKMCIASGHKVLDLGCGSGIDVITLADRVGPNGQVVGLDHDKDMLKQASQNCLDANLMSDYLFVQGSADYLPFKSDLFASCRSERLFMHLSQPDQTLSELLRVTEPSGHIVIIDTDWASLSIDSTLPGTERTLSNYRISHVLKNGYSGRSLYRQFKALAISNIKIEVIPIYLTDVDLFYFISLQNAIEQQALADRVISEKELSYWRKEMELAAQNGSFYCSVNIVIVSGQKPN
jgi:ubiquinone/menaquinone biosynthesis C-methylase UbiE